MSIFEIFSMRLQEIIEVCLAVVQVTFELSPVVACHDRTIFIIFIIILNAIIFVYRLLLGDVFFSIDLKVLLIVAFVFYLVSIIELIFWLKIIRNLILFRF